MTYKSETNNGGFDVTPNDSVDLPQTAQAIRVNVAGLVKITTPSGWTTTIHVNAGVWDAQKARRIWSTGTDTAVKNGGIKAGVSS